MAERGTTQSFIEKAKSIHGDKYDYSKVEYVNNRVKVYITCPKHGLFLQTPKDHLNGCGCPLCFYERCGDLRKKDFASFVKQCNIIHNNKYDYSNSNYVNAHEKIIITCPIHGDFKQAPINHLQGQGCPLCANKKKGEWRRSNTKEFIEKAKKVHGNRYDYSKSVYINNHSKICIICPEHGEFWQKPNDHLRGIGCYLCGQKYNITELKVLNEFKKRYKKLDIIYQYRPSFLSGKTSYQSIDFYIPKYRIGIEYNGRQHFQPIKKFGGDEGFEKTYKRDLIKYKKCIKNNITMFYLTLEKCNIENYFTKVYTNIEDIFNEIDNIIKSNKTINLNEDDIRLYVRKIINEIKKQLK